MAPSRFIGLEVKPLKVVDKDIPRAIQLVMTMSEELPTLKTIGEHQVECLLLWIQFLIIPFVFIAVAGAWAYKILCDKLSMGIGDSFTWWLLVTILLHVYPAVVQAAAGHLGLFLPQTPYSVWNALNQIGFRKMGLPVMLTSIAALMLNQKWLLITWACLLGLLVAATIAFWMCLVRTYGGSYSSLETLVGDNYGGAIIDSLAYLYSRLLYEYAIRFAGGAA